MKMVLFSLYHELASVWLQVSKTNYAHSEQVRRTRKLCWWEHATCRHCSVSYNLTHVSDWLELRISTTATYCVGIKKGCDLVEDTAKTRTGHNRPPSAFGQHFVLLQYDRKQSEFECSIVACLAGIYRLNSGVSVTHQMGPIETYERSCLYLANTATVHVIDYMMLTISHYNTMSSIKLLCHQRTSAPILHLYT